MKYLVLLAILSSLTCMSLVYAEEVNTQKSESERYNEKKILNDPSDLRKKFERETGIVLGNYALSAGSPESCLDGKLGLLDYGNELTLVFGARSLAVGIGKEKIEEVDESCKTTYQSVYSKGSLKEVLVEVCGATTDRIETDIKFYKNKISYTKTIISNGKQINRFTCEATKR